MYAKTDIESNVIIIPQTTLFINSVLPSSAQPPRILFRQFMFCEENFYARALYFSFLFSLSEQHNILVVADVFEAYLYQFLCFFYIVSNG